MFLVRIPAALLLPSELETEEGGKKETEPDEDEVGEDEGGEKAPEKVVKCIDGQNLSLENLEKELQEVEEKLFVGNRYEISPFSAAGFFFFLYSDACS